MEIRRSNTDDINEILNIFEIAKQYMIEHGNNRQWNKKYPGLDSILDDINNDNSYVITSNNEIVGVFTFIIGEEENYKNIINGSWHKNIPYGTIHRLASSSKKKGIAKACFDFCTSKIDYVRIDTHKDNTIMQQAIINYGFKECGNIFVEDGSARIAYDWFKD